MRTIALCASIIALATFTGCKEQPAPSTYTESVFAHDQTLSDDSLLDASQETRAEVGLNEFLVSRHYNDQTGRHVMWDGLRLVASGPDARMVVAYTRVEGSARDYDLVMAETIHHFDVGQTVEFALDPLVYYYGKDSRGRKYLPSTLAARVTYVERAKSGRPVFAVHVGYRK